LEDEGDDEDEKGRFDSKARLGKTACTLEYNAGFDGTGRSTSAEQAIDAEMGRLDVLLCGFALCAALTSTACNCVQ